MADGWVASRLGARLDGEPRVAELVRLGLRRNPRRAHLLVSPLLGKHVPADPAAVHGAGRELGQAVRNALAGRSAAVLGFAETATGLGHCVAETLGAPYLHSTRRPAGASAPLAVFEEEHSHATAHRLLPDDPQLLSGADVVVLVDDELSTGRTAANTIRALHRALGATAPDGTGERRYLVAALVDLRPNGGQGALDLVGAELGVPVATVALATGSLDLPAGFAAAAADALDAVGAPAEAPVDGRGAEVVRHVGLWPPNAREGGRHGFGPADAAAAREAAGTVAAAVAPRLAGEDVLVLGTEELIYAPMLVAERLAGPGRAVVMSSTTRSPVAVVDAPGYPIRDVVTFAAPDRDPSRGPSADSVPTAPVPGKARFAYNVGTRSDIVLVVDDVADTPALRDDLVTALARRCRRLHVVVLPASRPLPPALRGPDFGSYRPDEVAWLLTDLSAVPLEAPTEEREEAVQSGGAHYAESLPIEYCPDADYEKLFDAALTRSADRLAHAIGVVTELLLAERGADLLLASLARAGTPIGILIRRWAAERHGLDLPHYAVSIVRGRGLDPVALDYLARRHRPADVVFVDGWTGKGAITRELAAAVQTANDRLGTDFDPALAVLADPGCCVRTFGTRDDFLVPSACLNSTVSGLVSRTVLNERVLPPGAFHGAKYYRDLADADVSARFVDKVSSRFAAVADAVSRDWLAAQRADRAPTWAGLAAVQRLADQYGIGDPTLVKPGVGETTRVLLRRVPWAVLVRPDRAAELEHVLLLVAQRGVPVREVDDLAYSCVGLIHPRYTRGASGADGTAVR